MRYVSLFSGIEAASVAWRPLGWELVAVAEVAPFPSRVLAHRFPGAPNLGDVSTVTDEALDALGPVDVVVGGFPCQDVSIAGRGAGLENTDGSRTRSGLFFDAMRIVRRLAPRWVVIENVPGLYSSSAGEDFRRVVSDLAGSRHEIPRGGWQTAGAAVGPCGLVEWRTLDAQWFGLAQRRRRVFLVRDAGDWRARPPVLLEPEGLSRNPPSRDRERQDDPDGGPQRARACGGEREVIAPAVAETLTARMAKGFDSTLSSGQTPLDERCLVVHGTQDPDARAGVAHTLPAKNGGIANVVVMATNQRDEIREMDILGALPSRAGGTKQTQAIDDRLGLTVRRLTPRECERLQGFPDDWTQVPDVRGKPAADTPRYAALGNSMPVPVMRWIGERIEAALAWERERAA